MYLSIVIPVYNESRKIDQDLLSADRFLETLTRPGEIILSDDGSNDNTLKIPDEVIRRIKSSLVIINNLRHHGKGYAVRQGILKARGDFILFIDSGSCIPYEEIRPGLELIQSDRTDIAHGSRFLPESRIIRKKQWDRRLSSYLFRKLIRYLMNVPVYLSDTQCGLKIYKKDVARQMYMACRTEGFMFDIEVILRAVSANYRIREFPVTWTADRDSRLSISDSFFNILAELKRIREMDIRQSDT